MKLIYIASPLFNQAELSFNLELREKFHSHFRIYLPQIDGNILTQLIENGESRKKAYQSIFNKDIQAIKKCDILLAVLDGRSIDEGVAFELGYAYSLGKVCIGLQTDSRRLIPYGNNPMIESALQVILSSIEELNAWLTSNMLQNNDRYKESQRTLVLQEF
jgi:nucleoside 2-deoxyribosyltransferase